MLNNRKVAIVGADGIETLAPIELSEEEQEKLKASADALREIAVRAELI